MSSVFIQILFSVLIIISIAIIAAVRVGALWLRMALIALLVIMLSHRIDSIGSYFGLDIISPTATDLITLVTIAIILCTFIAARIRRPYLVRAEKERQADLHHKHGPTINELESLREKDELTHRQSWDVMTLYPSRVRK